VVTEVLLLCSGGLDSTTVAYLLRERSIGVVPIFFDYGQHCVEKEWATLHKVLPKIGVSQPERVDISGIFRGSPSRLIREPDLWTEHVSDEDLYVPYRTLLFFSAGAACAQTRGLREIYSGFINSNHAKEIDCSATFLNGLDELAANVGSVKFQIPFRNWSKAEVVAEAGRLGVPIGATFSCQLLSDTACGACPNCVERLAAIESARSAH
jgi:7-cyano-7-deazaguanine synthase